MEKLISQYFYEQNFYLKKEDILLILIKHQFYQYESNKTLHNRKKKKKVLVCIDQFEALGFISNKTLHFHHLIDPSF